ncbi:hypothetical protein [Hymenobacter jeollabukensis]|uniref:Uncharacterized protein n=1 Tax=Hymenobacter jeollabukensis TaxID=2025313 RepID=A0A5R8WJ31_9BACT|nr:hypothetical protein [Hymenobacter jeollabukensis]TLM88760.1 hypothetical protein FDY95_23285 [Hymenobacter jeollabukensis]
MQHTWRTLVEHILNTVPADQLDSMALAGPHPEVLMPLLGLQRLRTPQPVLLTENGQNSYVTPAAGAFYLSTDQCCRSCGQVDLDVLSTSPDARPFLTWVEPDLCSACAATLRVAPGAPVPAETATA